MTLDPAYLEYPKRREGYDHDLYPWSNLHHRPPVTWPRGSVAVWVCVSLEWFPITPADAPFRAPGHMQTAYPDYRHYTARDYGNRIGAWRFLDAFARAGVTASFATNAAVAERYPELLRAVLDGGHEVVAHSTDMNGTIDSTLAEADERALIGDAVARLKACGVEPTGWLSLARSQSWRTLDLLHEAGLTYCCDWVNDELPYRFTNGLIDLPLNHELSDRQMIAVQQQSADVWAQSLEDAFDWLAAEAAREGGGRMLPIHVTPYIMGLPYRIAAFERLLERLTARPEAWFARADEIVASWAAQA
ncbi:polysaccharide deacetylase family protein [Novosphingobium sp. Gsoil 351]|uniref:polysaccharide deacetylase family protein n=1 Tax=Novosphingobium sp. Gsoil 351 TaxID=2675225 RepID=UPI0012B4417F|nr:polysaccharide deacetylase family protein [Novosphingobium sp. Gsoil 351]QGN54434.1 polysaccharide deacetylase family protein [Novosphingobium sp. Gsoil 351]